VDETRPLVQYFARTVCSTRWGAAVWTPAWSSWPPRPFWFPGQRRSTAQPAPRARAGAASLACSPTSARCSRRSSSQTTAADLSTAAGGRRLRRTHDRRGGQAVFNAPASPAPRQCHRSSPLSASLMPGRRRFAGSVPV